MESSGMTTRTPQPDVPPRPVRPTEGGFASITKWIEDVKAWNEHPAVLAQKAERDRLEAERLESIRPAVDCPDCEAALTSNPKEPWTIVECGPHRVDRIMRGTTGYPYAYRPVPQKYADANPDQLIPALREWDGSHGLYIAGPVGTGKTYQAAALVRLRFRVFDPPVLDPYYNPGQLRAGRPVVWANVPRLLEEVRRSFDAPDTAPEGLEHAPLVVLDDIGAEKPSEWVEERLYCIVNERYESGLPVIVTSNLTPAKLGERVGARLASRLREMCEVHGLGGRDRRLAAAS